MNSPPASPSRASKSQTLIDGVGTAVVGVLVLPGLAPRRIVERATASRGTPLERISCPETFEDSGARHLVEFQLIVPAVKIRQEHSVLIRKPAGNLQVVQSDFTAAMSSGPGLRPSRSGQRSAR